MGVYVLKQDTEWFYRRHKIGPDPGERIEFLENVLDGVPGEAWAAFRDRMRERPGRRLQELQRLLREYPIRSGFFGYGFP